MNSENYCILNKCDQMFSFFSIQVVVTKKLAICDEFDQNDCRMVKNTKKNKEMIVYLFYDD